MNVNYSKVSAFLIIFLIWNITSIYFIDYEIDYSGTGGIELFTALWIIWLFASLFVAILYLLDSKKNERAGDSSSRIPTDTRSKTADLLTSFLLGLGNLLLMHSTLLITTDGFTLGEPSGEAWFPGIGVVFFEIVFFLFIWIPSYFFILRKKVSLSKKMLKISFIFVITYLIIFIPLAIRGFVFPK